MRISDWSSDVCSSDLIDVKEADRLGQSADELDAAAKAAVSDNERLAVIAQGSVLHARSAALQTQILAQLLKVQSTWFALTALPPRSEEHTSELQSLMRISYAVFCLKKQTKNNQTQPQRIEQCNK